MKPQQTSVTAVMVTGKTVERYPLARAAVTAFLEQDYQGPHELLIVNDNKQPLYEHVPAKNVRQLHVPGEHTLGSLRNVGIVEAANDYVVQWDDDDYSGKQRLSWQVSQTMRGGLSIFQLEIHCDLKTGDAFVNNGRVSRVKGFAGTMLFPRRVAPRFPLIGKHEDTEFLLDCKQAKIPFSVLKNDPLLYTRFYHGHNTWSEAHVMRRKPGSRKLSDVEATHIEQLREGPYKSVIAHLGKATKRS